MYRHQNVYLYIQLIHTTDTYTYCLSVGTYSNREAVQLCGWDIGLAIARSQVQCPVVSVAVTVVPLSKELYSHCSSPPSCINGYNSPTSTARTLVTFPKGAVQDSERPLWRGYRKKNSEKVLKINYFTLDCVIQYIAVSQYTYRSPKLCIVASLTYILLPYLQNVLYKSVPHHDLIYAQNVSLYLNNFLFV